METLIEALQQVRYRLEAEATEESDPERASHLCSQADGVFEAIEALVMAIEDLETEERSEAYREAMFAL